MPLDYYRKRGLLPFSDDGSSTEPAGRAAEARSSATLTFSRPTTETLDLSAFPQITNCRVLIRNTGSTEIENPWVVANGTRNWFDSRSISREIGASGLPAERAAFRIWDFIRRNRYHWYPAENGIEIHSPVKFLNVYGYGFCDDSAGAIECLWKQAGFKYAQCTSIQVHVVPELYWNKSWHVLDADMEFFYPFWDGKGAAGVEDLADDPELVDRVSPELTPYYADSRKHSSYVGWWETTSTMGMTLRPGESLERCHYNWGKYHDTAYGQEPPLYGNGRQSWRPDLNLPLIAGKGFSGLGNVSWDGGEMRPRDPQEPMVLTAAMQGPYLYVGGSVEAAVSVPEKGDLVHACLRKPGEDWTEIGEVQGPFSGTVSFPLDSAIATTSTEACYGYEVALKLIPSEDRRPGAEAPSLRSYALTGEIQCAPWSLPALLPSRENTVAASFTPGQKKQLEVQFDWNWKDGDTTLPPPVAPVSPLQLATVSSAALELVWDSLTPDCLDVWREVVISWDEEGSHPVSPLTLSRDLMSNCWNIPAGWLQPGNTYYWRVREQDEMSDWSPSWMFSVLDDTPFF